MPSKHTNERIIASTHRVTSVIDTGLETIIEQIDTENDGTCRETILRVNASGKISARQALYTGRDRFQPSNDLRSITELPDFATQLREAARPAIHARFNDDAARRLDPYVDYARKNLGFKPVDYDA